MSARFHILKREPWFSWNGPAIMNSELLCHWLAFLFPKGWHSLSCAQWDVNCLSILLGAHLKGSKVKMQIYSWHLTNCCIFDSLENWFCLCRLTLEWWWDKQVVFSHNKKDYKQEVEHVQAQDMSNRLWIIVLMLESFVLWPLCNDCCVHLCVCFLSFAVDDN